MGTCVSRNYISGNCISEGIPLHIGNYLIYLQREFFNLANRNLELDLLTLLEQLHLLEQLQLQLHLHQLQPHHLDVVPHNGPQTNGVMMKTTMLIVIIKLYQILTKYLIINYIF